MEYNFTLKDNKQKAWYHFTWFLFFLHIISAVVVLINNSEYIVKQNVCISLVLYAVLGIYLLIYRRENKKSGTISWLLAFVYANFWFFNAGIVAVLIFAVVYIVVTIVKGKNTTILFAGEGIHIARVFKTTVFPWAAMDNVILKDNLLTIDFKTNKIIQVEIVEPEKAVDESEFNRFCNELMKTPSAVANPDGDL